ncbi:MAG TPA: TadE family protein [Sphingomicrobium sp.]|nr:TadE family protein [Sphingomicrobium sp.]
MKSVRRLAANREGMAAVEFAVAFPVLIMMIWGIFQVALLYRANAGMQHALGEGARMATIWPTPSTSAIQSKITAHKFGLNGSTHGGTWGTPSITTNTTDNTMLITVTYNQPTDFLFFSGPTVSLSRSKLVHLAD